MLHVIREHSRRCLFIDIIFTTPARDCVFFRVLWSPSTLSHLDRVRPGVLVSERQHHHSGCGKCQCQSARFATHTPTPERHGNQENSARGENRSHTVLSWSAMSVYAVVRNATNVKTVVVMLQASWQQHVITCVLARLRPAGRATSLMRSINGQSKHLPRAHYDVCATASSYTVTYCASTADSHYTGWVTQPTLFYLLRPLSSVTVHTRQWTTREKVYTDER